MQTIEISEDIALLTVTASSFPEGIMDAHKKLHALVSFDAKRRYFAISSPENKTIIYKAAAEQLNPDEHKAPGLDTFVIRKGKFLLIQVSNYMQNPIEITKAFQQLISSPDIDPQGYCLEWYVNDKDVHCMVPLK